MSDIKNSDNLMALSNKVSGDMKPLGDILKRFGCKNFAEFLKRYASLALPIYIEVPENSETTAIGVGIPWLEGAFSAADTWDELQDEVVSTFLSHVEANLEHGASDTPVEVGYSVFVPTMKQMLDQYPIPEGFIPHIVALSLDHDLETVELTITPNLHGGHVVNFSKVIV